MPVQTRDGEIIIDLTGDWHDRATLPEAQAVFPEQMSAAGAALSERLGAEEARSTLDTMRDVALGKTVSGAARSAATRAFGKAGLVTPDGEITSVGVLVLRLEGTKFLAQAGIVTEQGAKTAAHALAAVARTSGHSPLGSLPVGLTGAGETLAAEEKVAADAANAIRITGESAEAASLGSGVLGIVMKKAPVAGQAIAAVAAIMGIAAAHAKTLPPEPHGAPQTPEEKMAREVLEMRAEYQKSTDENKELVKGMLSLLPVPGMATAFEKYSDDEQEKMQARMDAAARIHGKPGRPVRPEDLVQQPCALDRTGPVCQSFNAQARSQNSVPAAPAADGGISQQKTARTRDAPR